MILVGDQMSCFALRCVLPKGEGNYYDLDKTRVKLFPNFTRHHLITHTNSTRFCIGLSANTNGAGWMAPRKGLLRPRGDLVIYASFTTIQSEMTCGTMANYRLMKGDRLKQVCSIDVPLYLGGNHSFLCTG